MEVTFEILREAGIRMPRAVGQAVSIVGGFSYWPGICRSRNCIGCHGNRSFYNCNSQFCHTCL
ncbi:spore germination protein [Paenibacillus rhizoplanae]